ncbi:gliding motility-associated C-terminal domain-containing protein [Mucilaginibacter gossypiicola]|uniref:Gliding motility-associated C-terminal domain-containing protein n=1 Tax=Mucilaginibacter gossypiicola TaxID=551995 RepID=A0A1H8E2T7_9SPHI|nr:gliding motility-associated C-terminal domain-containing protein [Mucilaginibacter gossypiicola]SEN13760.1 gliding motility-associated C-terminal domain-containing protein [Mucilaginibacter gossypiicola]
MEAKKLLPLISFFLIVLARKTNAQSLGDPVVSITFGSGTSTHSGALPADSGSTSYPYSSADFPSDGYYTIENTTAGAGNVWWSATDHTGNTGGYMMVVNASRSLTDYFYKRTITGLCSNTTYQFSAWVVNLLRSNDISPPNITFAIEKTDGTTIQSFNTGTIARTSGSYKWVQESFNFTLPAGVGDVVIKMINNSAGGAPANDLAIDDIVFRPYGPVIAASFSSSSSTLTASACSDVPQTYTLNTTIPSGYTVLWQYKNGSGAWTDLTGAGSTGSSYQITSPTVAGTYYYRAVTAQAGNINSALCRSASNVLTLTVGAPPSSTATANTPVCAGTTLTLSASTGVSYQWTGPNGFTSAIQNPTISNVTAAAAGTYSVTIKSSSNCEVVVPLQVVVNAQPVAAVDAVEPICEGNSVTLNASGGSTYSWSPTTGLSDANIANPVASPTDTTLYTVTVSNGTCTSTANVQVNVLKKPVASAGPDKHITQGQSTTLNGSTKGTNVSYYWTPTDYLSSSLELKPTASPMEDITYTLHVVSNSGCGDEATDEVFVRVYKKVVIPNTFTPNGDGVNDTWAIEALDTYPTSTTQVFNRYGALVFKSTGYPQAWDGKYGGRVIPSGTYYYVIDLKNGNVMSGWVMVAR